MIGRRVEVVADLDRVRVLCDGRVVADHERVWAWHQTITDPDHLAGGEAAAPQPGSARCARSASHAEVEVEQRALADYDTALGHRLSDEGGCAS